jgi:hypothetical protein
MANGNGIPDFWTHAKNIANPTTLIAIAGQTIFLVWWLSSFSTATTFKIDDLQRRMASVEENQRIGLARYAEIQGTLGLLRGQNESILSMLRDLQGDRRIRKDALPQQ